MRVLLRLRLRLWLGGAVALAQLSACGGQGGPFSGTWEASRPLYDDAEDRPAGQAATRVYILNDSSVRVAEGASVLSGRLKHDSLSGEICIEMDNTSRTVDIPNNRFGGTWVTRYAEYCGRATADSGGRARELQLTARPLPPSVEEMQLRGLSNRDTAPPRRVLLRRIQ